MAITGLGQRVWRRLPAFLSYLVAGGCFYWIFHDISWPQLLHSAEHMVWWRLLPVIALDIFSYLLVALEWQLLLRPVGIFRFRDAARAVFAGRFANDLLPVQLGYVVRIFLASRCLQKPFSVVVPSLLIERFLDGWWLGVGILALTFCTPLPSFIIRGWNILGSALLLGLALLIFLSLRRSKTVQEPMQDAGAHGTFLRGFRRFWIRIIDGVRTIARSHLLPAVIGLSALKLLVQGLAYYGVLWAYGLEISVWTGLGIFLIAYLGITVPSTPASAGVFQFFSVIGLELFGIEKTTATGVSLVAFVALTAPLAAAGFYAVATSGLKWRELREEVVRLKETLKGRAET